ncbi:MAG: ATP-binding protein [Longimicrobiaceae bacterium]
MNRARNPFAPGAGHQPPELAGRDKIMEDASVALERIINGRPDRGHLLLGLRGVGKTVLLNRIEQLALERGYHVALVEAPEEKRLAELLLPKLKSILVKLSRLERAKALAMRALGVVRSFASAFKVNLAGVEIEVSAEEGVADSGDLESDLPELLLVVGEAAAAAGTGVAILIDEVQYLSPNDLSALIVAIHRVSQRNQPVVLFGAGLPQLAKLAGDAKSYAERLFRYPPVDKLDEKAAEAAIRKPIEGEGATIDPDAVQLVCERTQGYPYFLQEWGYHSWDTAPASPISVADVEAASIDAATRLDEDFFRVRFDRLTDREKDYMRAMAELGPGPHRSGDIATALKIELQSAAPLRDSLIKKGMIYSEQHGRNAFTVPMFDDFMRRAMPDWTPPAPRKSGKKKH